MKIEIVGKDKNIARVFDSGVIITDTGTALDLMVTIRYETKCDRVIIDKTNLSETFFKLSTGIAGEILQKFVNYQMRLAIVGDFLKYSSKPLKDFIYESNKGNQINFVSTEEDAIMRLSD